MKDYYDILQISRKASNIEIKKSYFKLVRRFSPEISPNEFKEIREAYEILINDKTREEYDKIEEIPNEIRNMIFEGKKYLVEKRYDKATKIFEKVLKIHKENNLVCELLGEAYLGNRNFDKATKIFSKLYNFDNKNSAYSTKLAQAYLFRGFNKKAEKYFKISNLLDEDNISVWLGLSTVYINSKKVNSAIKILINGIKVALKNQWDYLELEYNVILIYVTSNRIEEAKKRIFNMIELDLYNEDIKDKWNFMLMSIVGILIDLEEKSSVKEIIEKLKLYKEKYKDAISVIVFKYNEMLNEEEVVDIFEFIDKIEKEFSFELIDFFRKYHYIECNCEECVYEVDLKRQEIINKNNELIKDIKLIKNKYNDFYKISDEEFLNSILNGNYLKDVILNRIEKFRNKLTK